jgi:DNA replication protein DnaC
MDEDQLQAYQLALSRHNLRILGQAGTGKTFLTTKFVKSRIKPRVIVAALPSCMMLFDLETKLLRYSRRDFLEKIDVRTEIRTWAIR